MPIILEHRHRLLHMRAFLAERNRGQSEKDRREFKMLQKNAEEHSMIW